MMINKKKLIKLAITLGLCSLTGYGLWYAGSPQGIAQMRDFEINYYLNNDPNNPKLPLMIEDKMGGNKKIALKHYELIYDVSVDKLRYDQLKDKNEKIYLSCPDLENSSYLLYQSANVPLYSETREDGMVRHYFYAQDYMIKLASTHEPVRINMFMDTYSTTNALDSRVKVDPMWRTDPQFRYYNYTSSDINVDKELIRIRESMTTEQRQTVAGIVEAYVNWITSHYDYNFTLIDRSNQDEATIRANLERFYGLTTGSFIKDQVGVCLDFANFLSYALNQEGIPNRIVSGYRVNGHLFKKQIQHVCLEVYDGSKWRLVEPTLYYGTDKPVKKTLPDGKVIEVIQGFNYQPLDGDMLPICQYAYQSSIGYDIDLYFTQLNKNSSMEISFKEFLIH